jgi:hypothetical protein
MCVGQQQMGSEPPLARWQVDGEDLSPTNTSRPLNAISSPSTVIRQEYLPKRLLMFGIAFDILGTLERFFQVAVHSKVLPVTGASGIREMDFARRTVDVLFDAADIG